MPVNSKPKISNRVFYTIITIVAVVVLSAVLAYASGSQDPISRLAKSFYPAAIVGGDIVSIQDWEQNLIIAKKINPSGRSETIGQTFLDSKKKERVFHSLNLDANLALINREFEFAKSESSAQYAELIKSVFSDNEKLFIKYIVFPSFFDSQLRIEYNSDHTANATAYNKAQTILNRINQGERFEDLAKTDSDDDFTGQAGGDLGLVSDAQILPELSTALAGAEAGEVKKEIVTSRLGYHILYPVQTGEKDGVKVWHLKHILIQTHGYEEWLKPQVNTVWVWRAK